MSVVLVSLESTRALRLVMGGRDPAEAVDPPVDWGALGEAIAKLELRDQEVVRLRFGFGGAPMAWADIAELLGMTTARACQLGARAVRILERQAALWSDRARITEYGSLPWTRSGMSAPSRRLRVERSGRG